VRIKSCFAERSSIGKKIHPMLERSAKQLLMRTGGVQKKMVTRRM